MDTCEAKWKGGQCDRPPAVKDLCGGHYQQRRRGQDYAPLKDAHGRMGDDALEHIQVRVRREDKETLEAEARRRGAENAAEVYREAIAREARRLRKALDRSNTSDK